MVLKVSVRRDPVVLPKVRDQHLPGILGDFADVVNARLKQLRRFPTVANKRKMAFFEFLLTEVDTTQYGKIQDHFLDPVRIDRQADTLKYLDPVIWFESKLVSALRLGLDKMPPKRILDIGTGPGHFPVAARFFGHSVVGTELPRRSQGMTATGHLYDALCEVFKVKRISHTIRPYRDLTEIGDRYDMVTSFLAGFNMDEKKRPWGIGHWNFFLASMNRDVLTDGGTVFLNLADGKITPDVWVHLKANAGWATDRSKSLYFENLAPFGAVPEVKPGLSAGAAATRPRGRAAKPARL